MPRKKSSSPKSVSLSPNSLSTSSPQPSPLHCASTAELIAEIQRRALGCLLVCVKAEEEGDVWHYSLKGSPILLGALSAALSIKTQQRLSAHEQYPS